MNKIKKFLAPLGLGIVGLALPTAVALADDVASSSEAIDSAVTNVKAVFFGSIGSIVGFWGVLLGLGLIIGWVVMLIARKRRR